jgi:hypothetical protein
MIMRHCRVILFLRLWFAAALAVLSLSVGFEALSAARFHRAFASIKDGVDRLEFETERLRLLLEASELSGLENGTS